MSSITPGSRGMINHECNRQHVEAAYRKAIREHTDPRLQICLQGINYEKVLAAGVISSQLGIEYQIDTTSIPDHVLVTYHEIDNPRIKYQVLQNIAEAVRTKIHPITKKPVTGKHSVTKSMLLDFIDVALYGSIQPRIDRNAKFRLSEDELDLLEYIFEEYQKYDTGLDSNERAEVLKLKNKIELFGKRIRYANKETAVDKMVKQFLGR